MTDPRLQRTRRGLMPVLFVTMFAVACAAVVFLASSPAGAQITEDDGFEDDGGDFGGVYVDPSGVIRLRETAAGKRPEPARSKPTVKPGTDKAPVSAGADGLTYVSLPKLFAEVRACAEAGKPVPEQLRYLGGLTQIRYVLVYPEEQDLLIAGPAEPWDASSPVLVTGRQTGRPVMHLDDLIVALRQGGAPFGCTIDPAADSLKRAEEVAHTYARKSRKERLAALKDALGPQTVKVFGTPADTRMAVALVAADYRLKRMSLGADKPPVAGLGYAVDDSRAAASRLWFEPKYEPLLVSADGNTFEFRGPRLQLKAGAIAFDPRGAPAAAQKYAETFTAKMPQLVQAVPLFAELQNIADLNVLSALIRTDKLDQKAGWDWAWLRDRDGSVKVAKVPVPSAADTVVAGTNGSIVGGGVVMQVNPYIARDARQTDAGDRELRPARQHASELRTSGGGGAVLNAPRTSTSAEAPTSRK